MLSFKTHNNTMLYEEWDIGLGYFFNRGASTCKPIQLAMDPTQVNWGSRWLEFDFKYN